MPQSGAFLESDTSIHAERLNIAQSLPLRSRSSTAIFSETGTLQKGARRQCSSQARSSGVLGLVCRLAAPATAGPALPPAGDDKVQLSLLCRVQPARPVVDLLDTVQIARAAEKRRYELEAAMKTGKLHSLPKSPRGRRGKSEDLG